MTPQCVWHCPVALSLERVKFSKVSMCHQPNENPNQHMVEDGYMRHPELHSYNVAYPFCSIFHLLGNVAEVLAFSQKQGFSQKEKLDEGL